MEVIILKIGKSRCFVGTGRLFPAYELIDGTLIILNVVDGKLISVSKETKGGEILKIIITSDIEFNENSVYSIQDFMFLKKGMLYNQIIQKVKPNKLTGNKKPEYWFFLKDGRIMALTINDGLTMAIIRDSNGQMIQIFNDIK